MTAPALTVVVPAYEEADHLAANLERLFACLDAGPRTFEVVVVDDGSRDGTAEAARSVAHPALRVLRLRRNRGKGRALERGVAAAHGAVVVLLDADLEIPPDEIAPLVARLEADGADLALGTKYGAPGARRWSLPRRLLSRLYQAVTAVLFRLPLRDTQTGLKAIRTPVARRLVRHLWSRRFAWDLEFVLLACETGHRVVSVPVGLEPSMRASRVGVTGALFAAIDTLAIFVRHRWLRGYARAHRARRRARPPRLLVSGDDLGLSGDVDAGLLAGLETGGLVSVSALAGGASLGAALARLPADPAPDVGLHLDLLRGRHPLRYALASLWSGAFAVRCALREQQARLESCGVRPTHLDAHRHAWALPWTRRWVLREARRSGIGVVRALEPRGPSFDRGLREGAKRLLLRALAVLSRGRARALGLAAPDAHVDVAEARRWVRAGRLPAWTRGRTLEVIAHPALGAGRVPAPEAGGPDRAADARAVLDPPLARALGALGAEVLRFDTLARGRDA